MAEYRLSKRHMIGARLRAARLLAGIATIQEAAEAINIPASTLRAAEAGDRQVSETIYKAVHRLYAVDEGMIERGDAFSDRDRLANRLAHILLHPSVEQISVSKKKVLAGKLVRLRRDAGFTSASSAALAFGWKRSSYGAYEARSEKVSIDRLAVFAMKLTDDLESFFETRATSSTQEAPVSRPDESGPSPFGWLSPQPYEGPLRLPFLQSGAARLYLQSDPIVLPRDFLNYASGGKKLYVVQWARDDWRSLEIVDYELADGSHSMLISDGKIRFARPDDAVVKEDPTGDSFGRALWIGGRVCKVGTDRW